MSATPPLVDLQAARPGPEYWRRVEAGIVPYQHCDACGEAVFFPRVLCPGCGSPRLSWRESAGRGTVYSATTVHLRDRDPYTVALVDLEEGIRVMTQIDDAVPDVPPIGAPVIVVAGELGGQPALRATLATEDGDA